MLTMIFGVLKLKSFIHWMFQLLTSVPVILMPSFPNRKCLSRGMMAMSHTALVMHCYFFSFCHRILWKILRSSLVTSKPIIDEISVLQLQCFVHSFLYSCVWIFHFSFRLIWNSLTCIYIYILPYIGRKSKWNLIFQMINQQVKEILNSEWLSEVLQRV